MQILGVTSQPSNPFKSVFIEEFERDISQLKPDGSRRERWLFRQVPQLPVRHEHSTSFNLPKSLVNDMASCSNIWDMKEKSIAFEL